MKYIIRGSRQKQKSPAVILDLLLPDALNQCAECTQTSQESPQAGQHHTRSREDRQNFIKPPRHTQTMTTTHNHDVTPQPFIPLCDVPLLFYKTKKSLPAQQDNFPRCSHVAADQNKATSLWNKEEIGDEMRFEYVGPALFRSLVK